MGMDAPDGIDWHCARLHRNDKGRLNGEKPKHLIAPQLLSENDRATRTRFQVRSAGGNARAVLAIDVSAGCRRWAGQTLRRLPIIGASTWSAKRWAHMVRGGIYRAPAATV
jgi:hypothetical protein